MSTYAVGTSSASVYPYIEFNKCPTCGKIINDARAEASQQMDMLRDYYQAKMDAMRQAYDVGLTNSFYRTQVVFRDREEKKKMNYAIYEKIGFTEEQVDDVLAGEAFDSAEDCIEHGSYRCHACIVDTLNKMRTNNLPVLLSDASQYRTADRDEVKENFESQIGFVQKGLGLTDKQINDLKVKDIPAKMKEAQDKITVGKMKELMDERLKPFGFLGSILRFFTTSDKR